MRDRLIDVFTHLDEHISYKEEYGILFDTPFVKAVEYVLQMLKGVTVQEWISVEDRLPDKGGCYLIHQKAETWIGEVIQTAHWNETAQNFRGAQAGCFMEFVTHWMPLPQPPKGE